jgi:hypothetical protein
MSEAWKVAQVSLPAYAHRYSPKKFTQHQLFAILVLKAHLKSDYRGITAVLQDTPELCKAIELSVVPHYTTIQKASARLLVQRRVKHLLATSVQRILRRRKRIKTAAADSTGLEATHASRYYVWRAKQHGKPKKSMTYRHYPQLGILSDTSNHAILWAAPRRGPRPDVDRLAELFEHPTPGTTIEQLVADAGYDSESNHRLLREEHGVRSIIPPQQGRPSIAGKLPKGRYRRLMKQRFNRKIYRRRSQVETVISMLKRNLGSWVRGLTYHSQCREMFLKALTHNIMILLLRVFYRAAATHFYPDPVSTRATR